MGGWEHATGPDLGIYLQWNGTGSKGVDTGIQNTKTPMHVYDARSGRWTNLAGYRDVAASTAWFLGPAGSLVIRIQYMRRKWGSCSPEHRRVDVAIPDLRPRETPEGSGALL